MPAEISVRTLGKEPMPGVLPQHIIVGPFQAEILHLGVTGVCSPGTWGRIAYTRTTVP